MTRSTRTFRLPQLSTALLALAAGLALAVAGPSTAQQAHDTRLADATMKGDMETARALVAEGVDVNAYGLDGTPPLHWAARLGDLETARALIAAGADPNRHNRYALTPLHVAAEHDEGEIVALLLQSGADPNAVDYSSEPVLFTAARFAGADVVEALLDAGAEVDKRDEVYGQTALMIAAREGEAAVVRLLIDRGADVSAQNWPGPEQEFIAPSTNVGTVGLGFVRGGWPERGLRMATRGTHTPLLYAAREGRIDICEMLIAAGADVNQANADNISPLLMAILNEHLELAFYFIEQGGDVTVRDWWGETPLWSAIDVRNLDKPFGTPQESRDNGVDRERALELIETLLERGADPNVTVDEYPPDRRWINRLASIEWIDVTGQSPFLRAAVAGDLTVMRLLLEHGADPNLATESGTTPLMSAAGMNWAFVQTYDEGAENLLEAVKMCWELGGDVNAVNSYGLTAAHAAANRGSDDILMFLHEKGARLDVPDNYGRTPLTYAQGVFLATHAPEPKPSTIALLERLLAEGQETTGAGE